MHPDASPTRTSQENAALMQDMVVALWTAHQHLKKLERITDICGWNTKKIIKLCCELNINIIVCGDLFAQVTQAVTKSEHK